MSTNFETMTIEQLNPHFINGNIKVGDLLTFNKLAGNVEFKGCKGTCGENCKGCWDKEDWKHSSCYVAKSYYCYGDNVIDSHIRNTIAMRLHTKETFKMLDMSLNKMHNNKTVRLHSSGELESAQELRMWIKLAEKHQERQFYVYSKNFAVIDEVMSQLKRNKKKMLPDNMWINISIWHTSGLECYNKWKNCKNIKAFVYDDGFDYEAEGLKMDCHCPAYRRDEKGNVKLYHDLTCDKCQLCFNNKVNVIGCLDH